ncbi:MAG: hypothetical protein R3B96_17230 [Pirellulaceae bacterium]
MNDLSDPAASNEAKQAAARRLAELGENSPNKRNRLGNNEKS